MSTEAGFELDRVRRRIRRAREKVAALREELQAYDGSRAYTFQPTPDGLVFTVTEPPSLDWEHEVTEAIYQCRAALDNMLAVAVDVAGGDRHTWRGGFPIATTEAEWKRGNPTYGVKMLIGVPPDVAAVVEAAQPFHAPDGRDRWRHPLTLLARMSNGDRHRGTEFSTLVLRRVEIAGRLPEWEEDRTLFSLDLEREAADEDAPLGIALAENAQVPVDDRVMDELMVLEAMNPGSLAAGDLALRLVVGVGFGFGVLFNDDLVRICDAVEEIAERVAPLVLHGAAS